MGLGLLELWRLIYSRLLAGFGMLDFFTNLSRMEFQVRFLALFLLSSVIDSFEWFWMESLHKMLGLTFSSKLDWSSYIISIAKTASKKIGALIYSMKFLSPEVALYLYKSTICGAGMEYCCHVWASALGATWNC